MQSNDDKSAGSTTAAGRSGLPHLKLTGQPTDEALSPSLEKGGEEGEGGEATPFPAFTPSMPTNAEFLAVVFADLPKGARPIVTAKAGDPGLGGWLPHDANDVESVCTVGLNTYFNCASVYPTASGELRAKKNDAAVFHALVLDDVGTKVDRALLGSIKPTWELETSPGNFQIGFVLSTPETDADAVVEAQRLIAEAGLCDTGALGMTRWARLPNGSNGKPKNLGPDRQPFRCRQKVWNPDVSYELNELVSKLVPDGSSRSTQKVSAHLSHATSQISETYGISGEVFFPAKDENPVVTALKEAGQYKRESAPCIHDITCPWIDEHTGPDNGAAYFEPSSRYPLGGFKCHHSHGDQYKLKHLLDHLGLSRKDVRNRPVIRIVEGELTSMVEAAQVVLADTGEYFQAGGLIVRVVFDPVTGGTSLQPQTDADLTLALARAADWERQPKEGKWLRCNPMPNCVRLLIQAQSYDRLPHLKGIARQPFLDAEGSLVFASGYHPASKMYCTFDPSKYVLREATEGNAREALSRLLHLLREFRFATPRDEATAIAAIFTAVLRTCLGRAPAFHYRAPSPGSGKSLLGDVTARFAGPGHPAKVSYPRTEEEATKAILAALLQAPAVLDFDDMAVDWRPWGAVNRLLTSPTMTDRILGASKMATVSTDTLVLGSGNNTGPTGDLCRRVIVIELDTRDESPATIRYEDDPLAAVERDRDHYVSDVLLIVSAWTAAGRPKADLSAIATYGGRWSDFCRQTLVWLGLEDPAQGLIEQLRDDPDLLTLGHLLGAWHARLGEKPMTLRALIDAADGPLHDAIEDLPFVEGGPVNRTKLGYYLKRNAGRPVAGFRLEKAPCSERNAWKVCATGSRRTAEQGPPLPPSPPSAEPGLVRSPPGGRKFD